MIPRLELDRTETPSPVNPLGVKGVGEAGTIGATPAIVAQSLMRSRLSGRNTSTCLLSLKRFGRLLIRQQREM